MLLGDGAKVHTATAVYIAGTCTQASVGRLNTAEAPRRGNGGLTLPIRGAPGSLSARVASGRLSLWGVLGRGQKRCVPR